MNERIKALAEQATNYADYYAMLSDGNKYLIFTEKFAELIVKECIKLCGHEANKDEYDQYDMGMSVQAENIKTAIKQHFGVES
jgi:hypothetical protein